MNHLKVLIADDDPNVCEIIRLFFEQNEIQVIEANTGKQAVQLSQTDKPDVIILDIMMPDMDGFEVCRKLRQTTNVPIIMLTAKDDEVDRILGLEIGADDYVTKPFSPRELVARIKAILRRTSSGDLYQSEQKQQSYHFNHLIVHSKQREVVAQGQKLFLRPKEFDLLIYLIQNYNVVLTREELLKHVWGYDYIGDMRTVDVHIKKVRSKLSQYGIECIHTVWGVGYRFEMKPEPKEMLE